MIKDCMAIFEECFGNDADKVDECIVDNSIQKEGTYFLVNIDGDMDELEPVDIEMNKKTKELTWSENQNKGIIKKLDYYSGLLEMNKPIDPKKIIHSSNFMSFFVKKESLLKDEEGNRKLTIDIISGYYDILRQPAKKYGGKRQAMKLYSEVESEIGIPDTALIDKIEKWIGENIFSLCDDLSEKNYLKVLFRFEDEEETTALYKKESKRYVIPNLYNKNDHNYIWEDETYGLPNDNMGMNSKKPFMGNLSRGGMEIPYALNKDDAMRQWKFFGYLLALADQRKYDVYFDEYEKEVTSYFAGEMPDHNIRGFYLRLKRDKSEAGIVDYRVISGYRDELENEFEFRKYIVNDNDEKSDNVSETLVGVSAMEVVIDNVLFGNCLKTNYFTTPENMKTIDKEIAHNLLIGRDLIWDWLRNGQSFSIERMIDDIAYRGLLSAISKGHLRKARERLNFMWAFEEYVSEENRLEEKMEELREDLRKRADEGAEWKFATDEEYFYTVGQLVGFFIFKSKAGKKALSLANPYLNAKSDDKIKELLEREFERYNYDIEGSNRKFCALYGSAIVYKPKGENNSRWICAGLLDKNIILMKKGEGK